MQIWLAFFICVVFFAALLMLFVEQGIKKFVATQ